VKMTNLNRTIALSAVVVSIVGAVLVASHRTATAQTKPTATREIPKFQADPSWPKIPNGWVLTRIPAKELDPSDRS
jgi:hypothetical protein